VRYSLLSMRSSEYFFLILVSSLDSHRATKCSFFLSSSSTWFSSLEATLKEQRSVLLPVRALDGCACQSSEASER